MTKSIAKDRARIDEQAARMQREADEKCISRLRQQGYRIDEPSNRS